MNASADENPMGETGAETKGVVEEEKKKEWNDIPTWVDFVKALLFYFIVTLLIGLFGASFIYLTTRGSEIDIILPTYDKYYGAKG